MAQRELASLLPAANLARPTASRSQSEPKVVRVGSQKGFVCQVHVWACVCFLASRIFHRADTTPKPGERMRKWKEFGPGAAVTPLPVPMTELHFPPEVVKSGCGARAASVLPLSALGSSLVDGRVTHTMPLF